MAHWSDSRSVSPVRSQWFIERSHQAMSFWNARSEWFSSTKARPARPSGVNVYEIRTVLEASSAASTAIRSRVLA